MAPLIVAGLFVLLLASMLTNKAAPMPSGGCARCGDPIEREGEPFCDHCAEVVLFDEDPAFPIES